MNNKIIIYCMFILTLSLLPAAAMGEMKVLEEKATISSGAALGAQFHEADGDRPSQFEAYRDLPEGFIFEQFHFLGEWNDPELPYYLRFDGIDLGQDDQNLCLELGKYGSFKLNMKWVETPRLYSTGTRSLHSYRGNGRFVIADTTQAALEATPFVVFDPDNASAFRTAVAGFLNAAPEGQLRVDRERGTVNYLQRLAPGVDLRLKYVHDKKEGNKLSSTGVYQRPTYVAGAVPPGAISGEAGERWRLVLIEVPEVIDYTSDMVTAGLDFAGDKWSAGLSYDFQNFENNISTLTFDNPFNFTPKDAAVAGAASRGISERFFVQDLPPSSSSHTGTLNAGIDLPLNSRFNATLSGGVTLQDDPFLPFSANTAMTTGVPGGDATDPALLPKQSLDGEVYTLVQNYVITSKPADMLFLTGKYRYYYYNNETERLTLPGYAELIDGQWHGPNFNGPKTPSYLRQNGSLKADVFLTPILSARADYGWERWRRWERNRTRTDEHKFGGGVTVKPANMVNLSVDYHWSDRDGSDEYTPTTFGSSAEASTARMWDQSDRRRHAVDAVFSLSPVDSVRVCADGSYLHDSFDTNRLGMRKAYAWTAGTDISFMPVEAFTLTANYSHGDSRTLIHQGSKTTAVAGVPVDSPTFTDPNLFYSKLNDRTDTVGAGVNGSFTDALEFGAWYNYTKGEGRIFTFNPNPRDPAQSINSSQALDYDDTKTANHEVRAELTYRFLKHFALNLRYVYENFQVDDYAWKDMGNQIAQAVQDGVVVNDTQRVLLLNSQYSDYDAHIGTVTLSYIF